jgi:hypothetical protein
MSVKYGATTLYLNKKNATAIQVGSQQELVDVIKSLITATIAGEFDDAIANTKKATREGFGK